MSGAPGRGPGVVERLRAAGLGPKVLADLLDRPVEEIKPDKASRCIQSARHQHGDKHPSLVVGKDGLSATCKACGWGGSLLDIAQEQLRLPDKKAAAAELAKRYFGEKPKPTGKRSRTRRYDLKALSEEKKLPVGFLQSCGLSDSHYPSKDGKPTPSVAIPYLDEDGRELTVRHRLAKGKKFSLKGSNTYLYRQQWLGEAREAGFVVLVEGESDVLTLRFHDFPALGVPGASNWNDSRDAYLLDDIPKVYLLVEPDTGGATLQKTISESEIRDKVLVVTLNGHKDVSALHIADPKTFKGELQKALDAARPLSVAEAEASERERKAKEKRREHAWRRCESLAMEPNILDVFVSGLEARGLVGESGNARKLFLALITRHFDRPVSVAVKGPSSAGKSFLVERVLEYFPAEAAYQLSAMSERALIYDEEPLSHRFLVLYEAGGTGDSEFASYVLRSLLSEGQIRYSSVVPTPEGPKPLLIEREGPTGLVTTTTAIKMHAENETRYLSLTIADSREQTAGVLRSIAGKYDRAAPGGFQRWHALAEWIETGPVRAAVPFAKVLAELIPPVAVRLRRDFMALLALIEAHAILHRATREIDDQGRVIATLKDYAVVRELVIEDLGELVESSVSPMIRETVSAVEWLLGEGRQSVSKAEVARALGLDKSSTHRRVGVALSRGFLVNEQEKRGRPARLVLGDPVPEATGLLPLPEELYATLGESPEVRLQSGLQGCIPGCNHKVPGSPRTAWDVGGGCRVARVSPPPPRSFFRSNPFWAMIEPFLTPNPRRSW